MKSLYINNKIHFMRKKLLLFLLFHLLLVSKLTAGSFKEVKNIHNVNLELSITISPKDTVKKHKKTSRGLRIAAILPPPSTTAGSSCGDGINSVQVNVYAFGAEY